MEQEAKTATNIKDTRNRKATGHAITIGINKLKMIGKNKLENGLALFCGTCVNDGGGEFDVCEIIIPPMPIKTNYYRCDKTFHVSLIAPLFEQHSQNAIILITGESLEIWCVHGTKITKFAKKTCSRQKSQRKGGQSAPRFQRIRLNQIADFVKTCANEIGETLYDYDENRSCVEKIIMLSSGLIGDGIMRSAFLPQKLHAIITHIKSDIRDIVSAYKTYSQMFNSDFDNSVQFFELLDENVDLCLIGWNEVSKAYDAHEIQSIYVEKSSKYYGIVKEWNCQINIVSDKLQNFGDIVGVKYYVVNAIEINEDSDNENNCEVGNREGDI